MADEKLLREEELSDEQLEGVAGGSAMESYNDMVFLSRNYGIKFDVLQWDKSINRLRILYGRANTIFEPQTEFEDPNRYFDFTNGVEISPEEARRRVVGWIEVQQAHGRNINWILP